MDVTAQGGIGARVLSALTTASRSTGIDFGYLAATAKRESAFDPDAKAPTSSATGLFQFIDQTWLSTLRSSGAELGYAEQAQAITARADGTLTVPDRKMRKDIMELRKDPVAASLMAGALTQSNAAQLRQSIGREPSDGELYIAHFLGAGGASRLINAAESTPQADATRMFPAAAKANRPIFYERNGSARTVAEVHQQLVSKHLDTQSAALALSESTDAFPASAVPDPDQAVSRIPALEAGVGGNVFAELFRPTVQTGLSAQGQQRLAMAGGVQSLFTSGAGDPRSLSEVAPPRVEPVAALRNGPVPVDPFASVAAIENTVPVLETAMPSGATSKQPEPISEAASVDRANATEASPSRNAPSSDGAADPVQALFRGIARFFGFRA